MLELYPFRYYDPVRKRWVRARYVATREDIAARHERFEITGPPELREPGPSQVGLLPPLKQSGE